ncbi:hypothetical protein Goari_009596 [Gossypium aridum]|uniref:Methyltransferase type 11 domain-containing protein n=1 Tax=Gossypium aridum TaxID=34290 RepID=A0A7J8XXR2_GOSAI|nr:hypothetical protein [Gossypium aridum]
MALSKMGLKNVIGVELIESLPLLSRANPHNLPFFDRAFDVAFTGHLMATWYPLRNAEEMERTVRKGGVCVVVVDECGEEKVNEIVRLFRRSRLLNSSDFTLNGRRADLFLAVSCTIKFVIPKALSVPVGFACGSLALINNVKFLAELNTPRKDEGLTPSALSHFLIICRAKAWVVEHNICRLQRKQIQLPNGLGGAARTEHSAPYNSPAAV